MSFDVSTKSIDDFYWKVARFLKVKPKIKIIKNNKGSPVGPNSARRSDRSYASPYMRSKREEDDPTYHVKHTNLDELEDKIRKLEGEEKYAKVEKFWTMYI